MDEPRERSLRIFAVPRSRMSGQGRPKGVPNKVSADMILGALDQARRRRWWSGIPRAPGRGEPAAFMALVALPLPVTGESARHQVAAGERRETQRNGAVASRNGRSAVRRDKAGGPLVISWIRDKR